MMGEENRLEATGEHAERLLQHLMHLKRYEAPDQVRMTKNKHNIMRRVREAKSNRRRSATEWIEAGIPWFFAEPRYGIALLFIAFAGLQYWGVSSQQHANGKMGIYTTGSDIASYEQNAAIETNQISYPKLPDNFQFFPDQTVRDDVKFVGRRDIGN